MTNITDAPEGGKGGVTFVYHPGYKQLYEVWLGLWTPLSRAMYAEYRLYRTNLTDNQKQQLREAIAAYDTDHNQ